MVEKENVKWEGNISIFESCCLKPTNRAIKHHGHLCISIYRTSTVIVAIFVLVSELTLLSISNVQMHTTCSSCPPDHAQGEFSFAHQSFRARPHQRGSSYLSIHLLAYMALRIVNKSPVFHLDFHRRRLFLHTLLTVLAGSPKQRGRKIATDTRTALPMMRRKEHDESQLRLRR